MRKAVIDVGSNSVLLLVAEQTESGWTDIVDTSAVTALGEGTKESGLLSEAAMERTLRAIQSAFADAKNAGAESVVAAATMAARIAGNTPEFLERARQQATPVVVLEGEVEAELGLLAVLEDPVFANVEEMAVIDIGGHSTEIVCSARGGGKSFRRSFPIGTLGLRGGVLSAESPESSALLKAVTVIDGTFGVIEVHQDMAAVCLGATGTNLVSIREEIDRWDPAKVHGSSLTLEEISRAVGWLSKMRDSERACVRGIEPGREKTIHIGALILERALVALHCEECLVSVRGWRHALLTRPIPALEVGF